MYLKILLFLVLIIQLYKWFNNKQNESFDGNCINKIKPTFSLKLSDYFETDENDDLKFDDKGYVDISYGNMDIGTPFEKDKGSFGEDLNILLSNPFESFDKNRILNYNNCRLSYLE